MIKVDSRKIMPGDTFVALRGVDVDGHNFIQKAIENGATKIICEEGSYSVPTMIVKDTREYLINYLRNTWNYRVSVINESDKDKIFEFYKYETYNSRNPVYGLDDIGYDPNAWPNGSISKYYGISGIKAKD